MPFSTFNNLILQTGVIIASLTLSLAQDWSPIKEFSFSLIGDSNKILDGCDTSQCNLESSNDVSEVDQFGDLAVYAGRQNGSGGCFLGKNWCTSGYLVEEGQIDDGTNTIPAYKIHPGSNPAESFIASPTKLMFRVDSPESGEYIIYRYIPTNPFFITVDSIVPVDGEFMMTNVDISELPEPEIFFVIHNSEAPSVWPDAASGTTTQKATVFKKAVTPETTINLSAQLFNVAPAQPFQPESGWNEGPDRHSHKYGFRKIFFSAQKQDMGDEGVVWQDQTDWKIYVTWFMDEGHDSVELMNPDSHYLVAASGDGGKNGEIVYITMGRQNAGDKVTPLSVKGYKVGMDGSLLASQSYDTSQSGLNVYSYFTSGSSLYWDTETNDIGWMLSRTMTRSGDGLNHQSCICVILDGSSLAVTRNRGQTSSHSWNNYIQRYGSLIDGDGDSVTEFLAVDLGDNFPRGVNVHKISVPSRKNKLVYQFKTRHGQTEQSPSGATYPVYQEISNNDVTFYKWSNDNDVYTEIAHPPAQVRSDGSIMIIFAGERPPLDNSMAVDRFNAPRNLGLVIVSDDLESILSEGESSSGGFYTFGGGWSEQSNEGIIWLTDFTPNTSVEDEWESALRIKTAPLKEDKILIYYEVWGPTTYIRTDMMIIDMDGNIVSDPTPMPFSLRLSPTDEPMITAEGEIVFFGMDETNEKLIRFHFKEEDILIMPTTNPTIQPSHSPTTPPEPSSQPSSSSSPTVSSEPTTQPSSSFAPTDFPPVNPNDDLINSIVALLTSIAAICNFF